MELKVNQVMVSQDRELFGVRIRQETKTSMLNISDLQEAYTHARVLNGWANRGETQHILGQKENSERIFYLLIKQGIFIKGGITQFMEDIENKGIIKVLKEYGVYKATGRGANKTVYANPYIWVLLAMELNPMLYAECVSWLTDRLILNRIEAGNFCKELNYAVYKISNIDYPKLAMAINKKIFGYHETGMRNNASQEQLKQLADLEKKIAFAIEMGYIKDFNTCLKEIERVNIK